MFEKLARLAGLGAFGACAGFVALFLGLVYLTWPGVTSGIDATNSIVTWISLSGVFGAIIVVHVVIGRELLRLGKGAGVRHPL